VAQVKLGDTVKVHYTGKLADDTVFDSSLNSEPIEFTIGAGQVIPGFEQAVVGMGVGEMKTTIIPAEQAYGPHEPDMVMEVDRDEFPPDLQLNVGQRLRVSQVDGQDVVVAVTGISGSQVTLDANHPLAGKDLTFDVQVVAIL
jgi:FKBP-type peptidyl-prolyl cis-trans isomerase 2